MNYESTLSVQSEVLPGVEFAVRKPSYGRKMEFDLKMADFRNRAQERAKKFEALQNERESAETEFRFATQRSISDLQTQLKSAREEEVAGLQKQIADLENSEAPFDMELAQEMAALGNEALRDTHFEWNPERVKWGLASVSGLEIDGKEATPEGILGLGSFEFVLEILKAIDAVSGMTTEQLKNLQSPTTFSVLVPATKTDTTANAASTTDSTETETAAA